MNTRLPAGVQPIRPQRSGDWDIPLIPTCVSSWWGEEPEELEWLVPGVLLKNEVTLGAGGTKLGKTMLAQQLMTAGAIEGEWIGQQVSRFRSFGYFAEDREQVLKIRQARINKHYGIDYPDLESEVWLTSRDKLRTVTQLVRFEKFSAIPIMTPRWHQLVAICKDEGIRCVLIDTGARTFGGNENDRQQVTVFIEKLTELAETMAGSVMLHVHPSKPGPKGGGWYSGSTAWESSVRLTVSLERPESYVPDSGEDEDVRIFRFVGSQYAARRAPQKIRWQDGVFVAEAAAPTRAPMTQIERAELDARMLEGVRRSITDGARIPADEFAPGSAPKRARRAGDLKTVPYGELCASVHRLLAMDRLVRVTIDGRVFIRPADMTLPGEG